MTIILDEPCFDFLLAPVADANVKNRQGKPRLIVQILEQR